MQKTRPTPTVSTTEIANKLKVTRAAVTQWCRQGLFAGAFVEDTARGPVWHIPQSDLDAFTPPKPGRPLSAKGQTRSTKGRKK